MIICSAGYSGGCAMLEIVVSSERNGQLTHASLLCSYLACYIIYAWIYVFLKYLSTPDITESCQCYLHSSSHHAHGLYQWHPECRAGLIMRSIPRSPSLGIIPSREKQRDVLGRQFGEVPTDGLEKLFKKYLIACWVEVESYPG
jgi:hypothetical protein